MTNTTIWAAAYISPQLEERPRLPEYASPVARYFYQELKGNNFPFDIGDDPSFFAAQYFDSSVTWGVCRADVRRNIRCGDWMIFFAATRQRDGTQTSYSFVGALRVESKLRQTCLFDDRANVPYRDYLNLLVRPMSDGWEHHEPLFATDSSEAHKDWLWRIIETKGLRKNEVIGKYQYDERLPSLCANNYIVFSKSESLYLPKPLRVARYQKGDLKETWESEPFAEKLRWLVFGESTRGLRTTNSQQPHRHFRREVDDRWINALDTLVSAQA